MSEVIIRNAVEKDLEALYEIEMLSFKDSYPLGFMRALYDLNAQTFLVAEEDGRPVGYVITAQDRGNGHIFSIAVHPLERGKNIGTRLMTEALKILKSRGVTTVRLEVRKSNTSAQRFYEGLGFKYSHTVEGYYTDEDGLVYYKSLQ